MDLSRNLIDRAPDDAVMPASGSPMFSRTTIRVTYGGAMAIGLALKIASLFGRTALVAPIDPNLHAAGIGFGVFCGIMLAAIEHEGWKIGLCMRTGRPAPAGAAAALLMAAVVVLGGIAGSYMARCAYEWHAFHGLKPNAEKTSFTVTGWDQHRSSEYLEVQAYPGGRTIKLSTTDTAYQAVQQGDHVMLPVQTGRGGVQRVLLPYSITSSELIHP